MTLSSLYVSSLSFICSVKRLFVILGDWLLIEKAFDELVEKRIYRKIISIHEVQYPSNRNSKKWEYKKEKKITNNIIIVHCIHDFCTVLYAYYSSKKFMSDNSLKGFQGNSLTVQWLRCHVFTVWGPGFDPWLGN